MRTRKGPWRRALTLLGLVALATGVLAAATLDPASAAQVCGCRRSANGRVRRITAGAPLTCPSSQTLVCWNEDPPPGDISARVCRVNVLTVADNTNTAVPFDMDRYDTDNIHDTTSNLTRLTAPTTGKYLIFGHIAWVGTASGRRQVAIYKNGDPIAIQNEAGSSSNFSISTHHELLAGDFAELFVLQDSGAPNDISAGCHPTQNFAADFGMVKLP